MNNHILQACDSRTLRFALTTATSVAETSSRSCIFHIYSSQPETFEGNNANLIAIWREHYESLGHQIQTSVLDLSEVANAPRKSQRYTVEVWIKPLLPFLSEFDNMPCVLWLDNDTMAMDDVSKLIDSDLQPENKEPPASNPSNPTVQTPPSEGQTSNAPFAACANLQPMPFELRSKVDAVKHFNGGVLFINVPAYRAAFQREKLIALINSGACGALHDEYALTKATDQTQNTRLPYYRLHARWNVNQLLVADNSFARRFLGFLGAAHEADEALASPGIIHFLIKPWQVFSAKTNPGHPEIYKRWNYYHTLAMMGEIAQHSTERYNTLSKRKAFLSERKTAFADTLSKTKQTKEKTAEPAVSKNKN